MLELSKNEKKALIEEIKKFYLDERDEEIGNLSAEIILEFFGKSLGKYFYNAGVRDAKSYILDKLEDISEIEEY